MKKVVLLFCAVFINLSLFATEIQLRNSTDCSCCICPKLQDYDVLVNYQKPSWRVELPKGTSAIVTLIQRNNTSGPLSSANTMSDGQNSLQTLNFLLERGKLFKQKMFSFSIVLDTTCKGCVPVLRGKKKANVAKLNGKNGFFVKRHMNDRHDAYVFEICQDK